MCATWLAEVPTICRPLLGRAGACGQAPGSQARSFWWLAAPLVTGTAGSHDARRWWWSPAAASRTDRGTRSSPAFCVVTAASMTSRVQAPVVMPRERAAARLGEDGGGQPGAEPAHRCAGLRAFVALPRRGFHLPGDVVGLAAVSRPAQVLVLTHHDHFAFLMSTRRSLAVMVRAVTTCQRPSPGPARTASRQRPAWALPGQQGCAAAAGHRAEGAFGGLLHLPGRDAMPGDVRLAGVRPPEAEHHTSVSRS